MNPEQARRTREQFENRSVRCHRCGAEQTCPCVDSAGAPLDVEHRERVTRARNPWPGDVRPRP